MTEISRNKAVLVSLNVSIWGANKLDREASDEFAGQKKLKNKGDARVWKTLVPRGGVYSAITGVAAKARKFHYANTFAWVHDGARILPTANYMEYMEFMRGIDREFSKAVDAFLKEYGQLQELAKESLNSIFKKEDYPSVDLLKAKFSIGTLVMQIPEGTMFKADVGDEESQRVREEIEKSVQDAFRAANRDLWNRMYSTITQVQERLTDPKGVREASLRSLKDMLGLLARLNVSGDERLEMLRKQALDRLSGMSLSEFKSDQDKRSAAIEDAKNIQNQMAAFMGGSAHVD